MSGAALAKDEDQTELEIRRSAEFMDLVTPNQSRLFGYIFAMVRNSNDAHDLYQPTGKNW